MTDHEQLASELIRAVRGRRSQTVLSRRAGAKSNVAYAWEAGRAWPTAAKFFDVAGKLGIDVHRALERFYRTRPAWLDDHDPRTPEGVAALLTDLKGSRSVVDVARAADRSRFSVARWFKGETEPRLPDFLLMVEVTSLRLLDFVSVLVDPAKVPEVATQWQTLQTARRAAYDMPFSHAVLRVIELEDYRSLETHIPGWIATRLGITVEQEHEALEILEQAGQIESSCGKWVIRRTLTVDTRHDPEGAVRMKAFWADVALGKLRTGGDGLFSYNLFSVSRRDLERLRALHRAYFRELRAIVAESEPAETVALANVQLLELAPPNDYP